MATHSSTLAWKIPGYRSLVGYSPWGRKESDTTELLHFTFLKKKKKNITLHNTFRRIDRIFFKQNTTDENVAIVFKSVFVLNVKGCSSICWPSNTLIILVKY